MISQITQKIAKLCLGGLLLFVMPLYADKAGEKRPIMIESATPAGDQLQQIEDDTASDQAELVTVERPQAVIFHKTVYSLLGEPKYPANFDHFDYVNPAAPKGGLIRLAEVGNFDNFNRYASRGAAEKNSASIYETLFTRSGDDITTYYPLLATEITYSNEYRWAEVSLNPKAHFQDGTMITAEDVAFTFTKFMTEGVPQYRIYYAGCSVTALDKYRVRIELPEGNREKLLSFVGELKVIPKHFWQSRNFAEPLTTPPIGSAPYYIADYKLGQYVIYQRDPNYWGYDLPVNRGLYNFDQKRIDYYMDSSIALEAFKAGEYDIRYESQPKNWFTQYQGSYFDQGFIIKKERAVTTAVATQWLAINLGRDHFKDRRVRQALTLAFDFEWLNRAFYYNSYQRPFSYFANTPYAASGKPSPDELALLTPFQATIPADAFGEAYHLPTSDGAGFNRDNLLTAAKLLDEAGYTIKNGQLIERKSGKPFTFELLTYMGDEIKYAIPYQQNLARLGIKMSINSLDFAQMTRRLRERDYDMMPRVYSAIPYPSSDLMVLWGSEYLNSTWNASGLHNEAIDSLIKQISENGDDEKALIPLGRALDRVLTSEYAMIPMWYPNYTYTAYWNRFAQPAKSPTYDIGIDNWWYDAKKAATLPKNRED
ncbi:extracellular solute-binding protein [Orbaceae bacterium ESL0721]|nr:extracellular solute-binding protein [Orbaceae bacterium ESL0721]